MFRCLNPVVSNFWSSNHVSMSCSPPSSTPGQYPAEQHGRGPRTPPTGPLKRPHWPRWPRRGQQQHAVAHGLWKPTEGEAAGPWCGSLFRVFVLWAWNNKLWRDGDGGLKLGSSPLHHVFQQEKDWIWWLGVGLSQENWLWATRTWGLSSATLCRCFSFLLV